MWVKFHIFKHHPLVKLTIWVFFYLYHSTTSSYLILQHFPYRFSVCLIWHSLHKFYCLKPIFTSPAENLNLVFVIICITAIAMGPRRNQSSILLAQIHTEKQYLLWRLENGGIQPWTPQRDMHFRHYSEAVKKIPDCLTESVGRGKYHEDWRYLPREVESPLLEVFKGQ